MDNGFYKFMIWIELEVVAVIADIFGKMCFMLARSIRDFEVQIPSFREVKGTTDFLEKVIGMGSNHMIAASFVQIACYLWLLSTRFYNEISGHNQNRAL
jgi:hypothetical protein